MQPVPGGDTPRQLTNSVSMRLSAMPFALVYTQQMVRVCSSCSPTGTMPSSNEYRQTNITYWENCCLSLLAINMAYEAEDTISLWTINQKLTIEILLLVYFLRTYVLTVYFTHSLLIPASHFVFFPIVQVAFWQLFIKRRWWWVDAVAEIFVY